MEEERKDYTSQSGLGTLGEHDSLDQLSRAHRDWSGMHSACMSLYQVLCICVMAVSFVFLWEF